MSELNPEIWNNRTLGAAAHNERLDRLEKQQHEDRSAKLEGREPREVTVDNDHPGWEPQKWASHSTVVHFADEQENDVEKPYDPSSGGENVEQDSQVTEGTPEEEEPVFVEVDEESDQL